jgi:flagellar biosynthesis protein FlhA
MKNRLGLIGVPAGVIAIVVMLVIPLPTFVLDVLISANIAGAMVVLLMTMHVKKPLDFSVFPAVLLVATLFRLALNVSATRLVLLHGYAGSVINSFGNFVVGGNLIVGLVVFLILIVIQFVVVTTGAGRVAEVAARFTLDAMPGKQMAIDADLNSGLINQQEAKRRRQETADEADFYGAMDGAAKFVRGDAIAAIVITAINLIGGLTIGIAQRHLSVSAATHTYSLLSVGDGLVSQIPALLLSISTGLVVTRAATDDEDFGTDLIGQVRRQHRAIQIAGVVMAGMAIVPGLPHLAFLIVGGLLWFTGTRVGRAIGVEEAASAADSPDAVVLSPDSPQALAADMRVEALELELSVTLVDLVDTAKGGDLLERVKGLRRKLATERGLIIPPVRTRDNVNLDNDSYAIRLHGVEVATGIAPPSRYLAIGGGLDVVPGETVVEPVFGLPAKWVPAELRQQALVAGATVIDRSSVITTHLGEVAARHAGQLLSSQQVKTLLDSVKQTDPAVIEEMGAAQVNLTDLHRVLCGLLEEGVAIRNLVRVIEAVTEQARQLKEPEAMLEAARRALGPAITAMYAKDGTLPIMSLDPRFERQLADAVRPGEGGTVLAIDPDVVDALIREVGAMARQSEEHNRDAVLICASRLRPSLRRLLAPALPRLGVLSVNELGPQVKIERIGVISVSPAQVV